MKVFPTGLTGTQGFPSTGRGSDSPPLPPTGGQVLFSSLPTLPSSSGVLPGAGAGGSGLESLGARGSSGLLYIPGAYLGLVWLGSGLGGGLSPAASCFSQSFLRLLMLLELNRLASSSSPTDTAFRLSPLGPSLSPPSPPPLMLDTLSVMGSGRPAPPPTPSPSAQTSSARGSPAKPFCCCSCCCCWCWGSFWAVVPGASSVAGASGSRTRLVFLSPARTSMRALWGSGASEPGPSSLAGPVQAGSVFLRVGLK